MRLLKKALRPLKPVLRRYLLGQAEAGEYPHDLSEAARHIAQTVRPYTMTTAPRLTGLLEAVEYLVRSRIPGSFVECGVYRGGSMMAAASCLISNGDTTRDLYLYDTYEGMSEPTQEDRDWHGRSAADLLSKSDKSEYGIWCYATLEDVQANMQRTGYPETRLHFIKGKVEDTIPQVIPDRIAMLRLDTDWYESTKHELEHLYPRLVTGGVLIIDDYGHWQGQRRAVDEYFAARGHGLYLHRLDYTGRLAIRAAD